MRSKLWWKKLPALHFGSNHQKLARFHYARVVKIRTMFQSFFAKFAQVIPRVKADDDEELVDPQQVIREKCREGNHAVSLAKKYEDCNARVLSRSQTSETCVEELFDLLHAIDHCVTEKLFTQLK